MSPNPNPKQLALPLMFRETMDLRARLDAAIARAREEFIAAATTRDPITGQVTSSPAPEVVNGELALLIARLAARLGLDLVGAAAWEAKIAQLEAELKAERFAATATPG